MQQALCVRPDPPLVRHAVSNRYVRLTLCGHTRNAKESLTHSPLLALADAVGRERQRWSRRLRRTLFRAFINAGAGALSDHHERADRANQSPGRRLHDHSSIPYFHMGTACRSFVLSSVDLAIPPRSLSAPAEQFCCSIIPGAPLLLFLSLKRCVHAHHFS